MRTAGKHTPGRTHEGSALTNSRGNPMALAAAPEYATHTGAGAGEGMAAAHATPTTDRGVDETAASPGRADTNVCESVRGTEGAVVWRRRERGRSMSAAGHHPVSSATAWVAVEMCDRVSENVCVYCPQTIAGLCCNRDVKSRQRLPIRIQDAA